MRVISKTNTIHFIIYIHYRDGEFEYTNKRLLGLNLPEDATNKHMKDSISRYLGFPSENYDEDDEGWWDGNRLFNFSFRVVPANHYEVLRRYL